MMLKRLRYILLLAVAMSGNFMVVGQKIAMPDYVYIGSTKHYNVDSNTGSTYTWKIDGVTQVGSNTNEIDLSWNTPGKFILSVQELTGTGCLGPVQTGEVYVYQFTLPDQLIECVENLHTATYDVVKKELITDQPDYFTFKPGDKRLDLSPPNFTVIFPSSCPVEIHWRIDFSPAPDPAPPHNMVTKPFVTGTGQPSEITGNILFPGDGVNFSNVVHTITYWIVDCHGNTSYTTSQTITIRPRPKIL